MIFDLLPAGVLPERWHPRPPSDLRVPIAVLGDSDSQGYRDPNWHLSAAEPRGGRFHAITLQWTEVLARMRAAEVDLGDLGEHGGRRTVVQWLERFGFERRAPRKLDHEYNFAFAGAHCSDLNEGTFRQVPRLLSLMRRETERWRRGAVVIRIGIVDLGGADVLDRMARAPEDPELHRLVDGCIAHVAAACAAIRREHAEVGLVLVGILDNADHPPKLDRWRDPAQLANIRDVLDRCDAGLRALAGGDPRSIFFDDRAWFLSRWGGRGPDGAPAYREVRIGEDLVVLHRSGDDPASSVLADGHAGLAWNLLWAQALSARLAELVHVAPIADREVVRCWQALQATVPEWR